VSRLTYSGRATKWAHDVDRRIIPACEYVRLACRRHLSDIEKSKSKDYPYRFVGAKGDKICEFAENMIHIKGVWAGKPIVLQDWQCFMLAVPFGWERKSDYQRRFRELFALIPRKNSKSTLAAIIGNYMLTADGEQGAEVYSGATSEKQALEVFRPAWLMVDKNPEFRSHFGLELGGSFKNPLMIYQTDNGGRFEPLIGKPGDGAAPSCAIVDEYHEHQTSELYDAMDTGMGSRAQPMLVVISTAGTDTSSPCYDKYLDAIKILDGTRERDDSFVIIWEADKEDDWTDFEVWKKVNPNYGVSVLESYLQSQHKKALEDAGKQNIITCKHLNRWSNASEAWMNMVKWGACYRPELTIEQCAEYPCWAALDLASKIDMCSLPLLFKLPDGWAVFCKHYLPEETVKKSENDHYRRWAAEKWLTVTSGARTDFHKIEDDLEALAAKYKIQELAFDPREATYLIQEIQSWADFECVEITQSPALISQPMKEVEAEIYAGRLHHINDPVFNWMMGNVVKKTARGGGQVKYYFPTKQKAENKIDGPVALIMAMSRAMVAPSESSQSIYETRGPIMLDAPARWR
jgi:phage terminase large subunit-like protein